MEQPLDSEHLEHLVDILMVKYPVVIADLSHAAPDLMRTVVARANHIIVVATPSLAALRLGRSLIHEIKELRGGTTEGLDLVINMQGITPANEVSKKDIEQAMEFKISSIIPFLPKAFLGTESQGKKLADDKEGELIVNLHLLPIIQRSLSIEPDVPAGAAVADSGGLLGGFLKKLKTK